VNEPNIADAIEIMKGLKPYFEAYHKLKYTNEAVKAAVELSARYIHDRKLPDKAIDVIDESGAAQMLLPESKRKKTIGIKEIETTIATMARIPPKTVSKDDAAVLQHLEQTLKTTVYGQDKAIEALASSIKLARAGLREPEKPIGCYLFSGPTGVGKTEVAKQLAASMAVELIRFDMSEYMERHTVSRLIGAPPGYVGFDQGGLLTDGVDQHPHCVLLLDEIEKAHPDLFNVLLQIMDHGKLTDHNGKQVDFRNVILIMTTNAGAHDLAKQAYGFTRNKREGDDMEAINRMFAPEFRNRLDAVITFAHLSPEIIKRVVEKFVLQLEAQLADRNVTIELSEEASRWLIANGYDELMGARPMARVIQEHIKKGLADEVLFGKLKAGGHVRVAVVKDEAGKDKIGFDYIEGPVTPKPEKIPAAAKPRKPRARKPKPPNGEGGPPRGGSVPKVPLVKV
jgi:ATP-dependent Clp protease ATP-binding subunit ClpA